MEAFIPSLCIIMSWSDSDPNVLCSFRQGSPRWYLPMCLRSDQPGFLASLRRGLNGLKPDEHFQGGERTLPQGRICSAQFFLGRHFPRWRGKWEKTLCNSPSQNIAMLTLFQGLRRRYLTERWSYCARLNVIFCVRGLFITWWSFPGLDSGVRLIFADDVGF